MSAAELGASIKSGLAQQLPVEALLEGFTEVHWYQKTTKHLVSSYRHLHLFGYLNPLRSSPLQIVDQRAMEWLFGMSDSELRESPCFDAEVVTALIMCDWTVPYRRRSGKRSSIASNVMCYPTWIIDSAGCKR